MQDICTLLYSNQYSECKNRTSKDIYTKSNERAKHTNKQISKEAKKSEINSWKMMYIIRKLAYFVLLAEFLKGAMGNLQGDLIV